MLTTFSLPQAASPLHGAISLESTIPLVGSTHGVTSSSPALTQCCSLLSQRPYSGFTLQGLQGKYGVQPRGAETEKGRGSSNNQHLGVGRLNSHEYSLIVPTSGFIHLQAKSVALSGEFGLPNLGPQRRNSAGPGAWSSHALAEELSDSYPAADHGSQHLHQKICSGKFGSFLKWALAHTISRDLALPSPHNYKASPPVPSDRKS